MLWIILAFFAGLVVGAALMVVLFGAREPMVIEYRSGRKDDG